MKPWEIEERWEKYQKKVFEKMDEEVVVEDD